MSSSSTGSLLSHNYAMNMYFLPNNCPANNQEHNNFASNNHATNSYATNSAQPLEVDRPVTQNEIDSIAAIINAKSKSIDESLGELLKVKKFIEETGYFDVDYSRKVVRVEKAKIGQIIRLNIGDKKFAYTLEKGGKMPCLVENGKIQYLKTELMPDEEVAEFYADFEKAIKMLEASKAETLKAAEAFKRLSKIHTEQKQNTRQQAQNAQITGQGLRGNQAEIQKEKAILDERKRLSEIKMTALKTEMAKREANQTTSTNSTN